MIDDVEAARQETLRYHRELYATSALGAPGSWLARPHRLVLDALHLVHEPVHAYDLGAGIGRHALPMAARLPAGSRVTAVDLLPGALRRLQAEAERGGLADRIDVVEADLEHYRFPAPDAGLVVGFSALEHVTSPAALTRLLDRCRAATAPGGVHVLAIAADRREVTATGERRALVECPLTAEQARDRLERAYQGWDVLVDRCSPTVAREERGGEEYELHATLVSLVVRAR